MTKKNHLDIEIEDNTTTSIIAFEEKSNINKTNNEKDNSF